MTEKYEDYLNNFRKDRKSFIDYFSEKFPRFNDYCEHQTSEIIENSLILFSCLNNEKLRIDELEIMKSHQEIEFFLRSFYDNDLLRLSIPEIFQVICYYAMNRDKLSSEYS